MKKKLRNTAFILILLCLYGCTAPTHIYIRNISNKPQIIILTKKQHGMAVLSFRATLRDIRDNEFNLNLENKLEKSITCILINDSLCSLSLPAHSTVLLDKTYNFVPQQFTSVKIGENDLIQERFKYTSQNAQINKNKLSLILWYTIQ